MVRARLSGIVCALAIAACSSGHPPNAEGGGVVAAQPKGDSKGCSDVPGPPPDGATCVESVEGVVLDSAGDSASAIIAVCGDGLCLSGAVNDGHFFIPVGRYLDLSRFVVHFYGYPNYGELISPLDHATSPKVDLGSSLRVARLDHRGATIPESTSSPASLRAGPVTLNIPAGANAGFGSNQDERALRAGDVPGASEIDKNLVALVALGPFGVTFSQTVGVELAVPAGAVTEGAKLDLVVLSVDPVNLRESKLVSVGTATVQGGVAKSDPGAGLSELTWVGLRTSGAP